MLILYYATLTFMPAICGDVIVKPSCHDARHHCTDCHEAEAVVHQDHICQNKPCSNLAPHGHINPDHDHDSCLNCVKDHLKNIFPFEKKIAKLNANPVFKQFLTMLSNLTPATVVSEIAHSLNLSSFISSPISISAMYLSNKEISKANLIKLFFTLLSSIGTMTVQKLLSLPKFFIRPVMALAVFLLEKKEKGIKNSKDTIKLLKLQGQINTVPLAVNLFTGKLKNINSANDNFVRSFLGHVGISALHIAGLSLGFIGLGHVIDKSLEKFNLSDEGHLAIRTEGAVCACCGVPGCIAEAASEVGSMAA